MTNFSQFLYLAAAQATLGQVEDTYRLIGLSSECGHEHAADALEAQHDELDAQAHTLEQLYQGNRSGESYGYDYTIEAHPAGGLVWTLGLDGSEFKAGKASDTGAALTALRSAARAEMEG